jgi:hypothetical protein
MTRAVPFRYPHTQRHPRAGGDPGHLAAGATPAASTAVAARVFALLASPRGTVTWIPAFAGMTPDAKEPATGAIVTTWEVRASGATEVKR